MNKIEILWISRYAPVKSDCSAGGNTFRTYYNSFLNDKRFEVRLITTCDYQLKNDVRKELEPTHVDFIYIGNPSDRLKKIVNIETKYNPYNRYAGFVSNLGIKRFTKIFSKYISEGYSPQIVILEWTERVVLASTIKMYFPNAKIVASEHDVTFIGYERKKEYFNGVKKLYWNEKYKNEKKKEIQALKICDLVLPHNPDNVDVLENCGIAEDRICWLVPAYNDLSQCNRNSNGIDILFFGAMSRPENYLSAIWFIDNVMPLLKSDNYRFVILGSRPPEELKKRECTKIVITGFVESIVPYFEKSMCMVAPLVLGAGIKVKIIEALSSGIPVLTNEIGIEGIHAETGRDYLLCRTPEEYAEAIQKAANGKLDSIGENGRRFVSTEFNVEGSIENYKERIVNLCLK